jgi:NADH:ubiquinone oxidoreductase subunit C
MLKFIKKTFFFLFYFIKVLNYYLKGLLISKTKVILSIMRQNLIFILTFLKYNLLASFSSLLDIIVVDNINSNQNRFELTYIFWNIYYGYRLGIKLYTTQLNGIISISNFYSMLID